MSDNYQQMLTKFNGTNSVNQERYFSALNDLVNEVKKREQSKRPSIDLRLSSHNGTIEFADINFPSLVVVNGIREQRSTGIKFKNCNFSGGIQIDRSYLKEGLSFEECELFGKFILKDSTIQELSLSLNKSKLEFFDCATTHIQGGFKINNLIVEGDSSWFGSVNNGSILIQNCSFLGKSNSNFLHGIGTIESIELKGILFREGINVASISANGMKKLTIVDINASEKEVSFQSCNSNKAQVDIENIQAKSILLKKFSVESIALDNCGFKELVFDGLSGNTKLKIADSKKNLDNTSNIEFKASTIGDAEICIKKLAILKISQGSHQTLKLEGGKIDSFKIAAGAQFHKALKVNDVEFIDVIASNVEFRKTCRFTNCHFKKVPIFFGADFLHKDVTFFNSSYEDVSSEDALAGYRELKFKMAGISNDIEEHVFSGLEINSRRKRLGPKHFEWWMSWLYKGINNYGRNLWLPFLWIGICFFVGLVFYYLAGNIFELNPRYKELAFYKYLKGSNEIIQVFYVSFINCLGPLRYLISPQFVVASNTCGHIAFFTQNLITSILWFFFVLGIRRRFKTH